MKCANLKIEGKAVTITIQCDRRIRKLNIEFTDGEYDQGDEPEIEFHQSNSNIPKNSKKQKVPQKLLSVDDETTPDIAQEVIEKPVIEDVERPVKVAEDMQNLSF